MNSSYDLAFIIGGLFLSLCVFSLILGDNYLFRLGAAILGSAAAAYTCVVLVEQYFIPLLDRVAAAFAAGNLSSIFGFTLLLIAAIFLVCQFWFRKQEGGHTVQVILIAIAAAVLVLGSVNGTLAALLKSLPSEFRISALSETEKNSVYHWIRAGIILICALTALLYTRHYNFFGQADSMPQKENSSFGDILIGFTFGAITAAIFLTSAEILVNHISAWIDAVRELLLFK